MRKLMKKIINTNQKENKRNQEERKKPYTPPQVLSLGDIRDVTMGGSPGIGDSGGAPQKPF